MTKFEYTLPEVHEAVYKLGIKPGDSVFIHSNIGFFGRCRYADTVEETCQIFLDAIKSQIGNSGTVVVPTFTYSYPRREEYDIKAPSPMGSFSEYIRRHPESFRSSDPCYSIAAIGEKAEAFASEATPNSFSWQSFFGRFQKAKGKILNFNFDAGSTFIHFVERNMLVPYRFDKEFHGASLIDGTRVYGRQRIFVRYRHPELEADFTTFDNLARKHGLFRSVRLGRGEMGVISAEDTHLLIKETLPTRPWFLTRAEILGTVPKNYFSLQ